MFPYSAFPVSPLRRGLPGSNSTPLLGDRNQLHLLQIPYTCSSLIPLLHHQIHLGNKWFPLTLTLEIRATQCVALRK
jgi:hypothetical protein